MRVNLRSAFLATVGKRLYSSEVELKEYRYQASKTIVSVFRKYHPWVHRNALSSAIEAVPAPALVRVVDGENRYLSHAIYEPHGSIAMRLLFSREPFTVAQFHERLAKLVKKKVTPGVNAFRLVNGEGDYFPGLTCDVYGALCVWQPYLTFWDPLLPQLAETVSGLMPVESHLVVPPSHRRKAPYALKGDAPVEPVLFDENGTTLCAWPLSGQKSGFFLDLKEVRLFLPAIVRGKSVLNCFANSGAFTAIARRHGAAQTLSIDSDQRCRAQAERQMAANGFALAPEEWRTADAFEELEALASAGKKFDVVIVDPPNMCTKKASLVPALKGWEKLLRLGSAVAADGGTVVAINCSSFMTRALCEDAVKGLKLKTAETGGLPEDHTARKSFPEGDYLKWWAYGVR